MNTALLYRRTFRSRGAQRLGASSAAAVLAIALGVMAAVGIPRYLQTSESAKADNAYKFLCGVQSAQRTHFAHTGNFASTVNELDLARPLPPYFLLGQISADADGWTLALTRAGSGIGYGRYRIVFNENGFDANESVISSAINPHCSVDRNEAR